MQTPAISQDHEEIPALLVPVLGMTLLLPTVSVAEMVPFRKTRFIKNLAAGSALFGHYEWRDQKVPLLSFERANGLESSELDNYHQVAIIHATGVSKTTPYIALLAQGIPHVARVNDGTIEENSAAGQLQYAKASVIVESREAVIPDVEKLEQWLLQITPAS